MTEANNVAGRPLIMTSNTKKNNNTSCVSSIGKRSTLEILKNKYMSEFLTMFCSQYKITSDIKEEVKMLETLDQPFFFRELFINGCCTMFCVSAGVPICGKTNGVSTTDIYGRWVNSQYVAENAQMSLQLGYKNSVIIYVSPARYGYTAGSNIPVSPASLLDPIAYEMALLKRAIFQNAKAMSVPVIVEGTSDQVLTLRNLYEQYRDGDEVIAIDNRVIGDIGKAMHALQLNTPNFIPELANEWERARNNGLTILGVNNTGIEKQERLLVDEVNANSQNISANMAATRDSINNGLRRFNEIYGTHYYCDINQVSTRYGNIDNNGGTENVSEDKTETETVDIADGEEK